MPESFWGVFQQARQALLGNNTVSRERLREQAIVQRRYLESDSGLGETLNLIIDRLSLAASLLPEHEPEVRLFLATHVREALTRRTPEMVADAVEFRIGRQRWQPFEQSSEPYRQLTADVMHATFHSFYRTGTWPRHARSHVARRLAAHIAEKIGNVEDALALQLLDVARSWEHPAVPLGVVAQEFRFLVADDIHFDPPALSEILREMEETEDTRLEDEDDEL